jgi:DNA polymerase I
MASGIRKAFFIDAGYTVKNAKTYITLILKGRRTVKRYYQYDPYFIVEAPAERKDLLMSIRARDKKGLEITPLRVEEIELRVGLGRRKMLKLYCREPHHVPIIQAQVPFPCHEYNIPFAKRFLFDMQLTPLGIVTYERAGRIIKRIISARPGEPDLTQMSFDIETYNPGGVPREDKDPAIMISYRSAGRKGVITYKRPAGRAVEYVETVADEKAMLERFTQVVQEDDPDILAGYNSSGFDLPYLVKRAAVCRARLRLGRFGPQIRPVTKGLIKGMKINGRTHADLYPMMKFFGFIGLIKAQRFTLDAVAEDVLGSKKVKMKKDDIWRLWDSGDLERLCEYSMTDADLTYALGKRFMPIEAELSGVAKMPLFDTTLSTSGQLVENLLMFHASGKGMLIPGKPGGESIGERLAAPIQGAFVKLPEPGIYENVAVLDFRGLYPSIIVSYNIDPGTLVPPHGDTSGCHISPTGAAFSGKDVGLIPFVLDYLIDMRMKIKKELKGLDKSGDEYVRLSARSHALKILANSFYGYMGYARSRWYSRPCAESVTAWGRKHIMETIETAEKSGFTVLYSDTDSVFLLYKDKQSVLDFMNKVNASLPEKMELELEGFYPRGVFVSKKGAGGGGSGETRGAKKKYALLGEDGRIKIRGFELVRRDWSRIAKDTQLKVLEAILREGSKEKAAAIIRDVVARLQSGKVPMEMLTISTQLNKSPDEYAVTSPELSAARKLAKAGIHAERGTMISYVIGKNGKTVSEKAEPIELAKEYDADYYINNQVMPAVMKIMKELGYDEYGMKFGGRQKSLEHFF